MTHSLHRLGELEDLEQDWVILCVPAMGINSAGNKGKMRRFLEICDQNNAVTMGEGHIGSDIMAGFDRQAMWASLKEECVCGEATFDREEDVARTLKALKEEDLGISIVVSGLTDRVDHICHEIGTRHHTLSSSLGIWGDISKLPSKQVLALTTMCGHGLVAHSLAEEMIEKVRSGKITAHDAAWEMAKDCTCGIFNPHRAERLLKAMAECEG